MGKREKWPSGASIERASEQERGAKKTEGYGFHETDISTYMVRSNVNSYSHKHHIPHHLQITTANYSYSKSLFIACESQCFSLRFFPPLVGFLLSLLFFRGITRGKGRIISSKGNTFVCVCVPVKQKRGPTIRIHHY